MAETIMLGGAFPGQFTEKLSQTYRVLSQADYRDVSPGDAELVSALLTFGHARTDKSLISAFPNLRIICCYGSGYDGVDVAFAKERGIVVAYSPGANAASVADLAMGLVIAGTRCIPQADRFLRAGHWQRQKMPPVRGLSELKLGIYGLGNIGLKVAKRAAAFDMEIAYHGRQPREAIAYAYHASLEALADWADVLVVAARADDANRHRIDANVLGKLGPKGYMVNIARGSIVDEAVLIEALEQGIIAGAALDVFENEPSVPERLTRMENVILTPHIGAGSWAAHEARQALVFSNLERFFAGEALPDQA